MIDWHSHILPAMDDGSRDCEESIELIHMLSTQGIKTVVATPHFYANDESVEEFLKRRKEAFDTLKEQLPKDAPNILLGAEVRYYSGISRMDELKKLCIEGTDLLLLEMPMMKWTEYMVREIIELASTSKMTVILAHVERYISLQSRETMNRLYDSPIKMQVNVSFFLGMMTKRKALSMLENGDIEFIGSDCHNVTSRAPQIGKAFDVIRRKLGEEFLLQFDEYGYSILNRKTH